MRDYFKLLGGLALIALTILIFWLFIVCLGQAVGYGVSMGITSPSKLPAASVSVPCPGDVDPKTVKDAKETPEAQQ